MRNLDYNKMMYVAAALFVICFGIAIFNDYINYNVMNNWASFYMFVIVRTIEFILPAALLTYLYNQNTHIKESKYIAKTNKITSAFDGYNIAHISDFHNTNSKRIKRTLVKKLERNTPDIIVITGDLIDSRRTNVECAKEFIQSIKHIAPIYYVLGNHESRLENITEYEQIIKNAGAIVLRNEVVKLNKHDEHIQLIGVDDPYFYVCEKEYDKIKDEEVKTKLHERLQYLAKEKNIFTILLIHRPEYLRIYSKHKVDLVFTGHAHGGQIRLPFVGGVIAPGQGFFPKYTKGVQLIEDTKTVISRGVGNSGFPFRINNRPELIFVKLNKE